MAGERGPLLIAAERQSAARGRAGRTWITTEGSLAVTLLFSPHCHPWETPQLSLVAGVAVIDALRDLGLGIPPERGLQLKWPNDIVVDGAKLGGILIESTGLGGETVAFVGIGLNLATAPDLGAGRATCLADIALRVPKTDELLAALADAFSRWLAVWDDGRGFAAIRAAWLERGMARGTAMSIHAGSELRRGRFAGLDASGALRLEDPAGTIATFAFGDVVVADEGTAAAGGGLAHG